MPTPSKKGVEGLQQSFQEAVDALHKLSTTPQSDERQTNLCTSLLLDLDRLLLKLPNPDDRDHWRTQLDVLHQQLQDASGEGAPPSSVPVAEEVVGDIDDLFSGMNIADATDTTTTTTPTRPEFVPQPIPGRRFMRVVRSPNGQGPTLVTTTAVAAVAAAGHNGQVVMLPDSHDAAGHPERAGDDHLHGLDTHAEQEGEEDDDDEENRRYKPQAAEHRPRAPSSPLRVLLPDIIPAAAADATAGGMRGGDSDDDDDDDGGMSHGSANSTMARGGGGVGAAANYSDSDDESITSPAEANEIVNFAD